MGAIQNAHLSNVVFNMRKGRLQSARAQDRNSAPLDTTATNLADAKPFSPQANGKSPEIGLQRQEALIRCFRNTIYN